MDDEDQIAGYTLTRDAVTGVFWISALDPEDGTLARVSEEIWDDEQEACKAFEENRWTPA